VYLDLSIYVGDVPLPVNGPISTTAADSFFALLPRGLRRLVLRQAERWAEGSLKNIPPSLEALEMPDCDLALDNFLHLPKGTLKALIFSA
jgi:hypothetical protein